MICHQIVIGISNDSLRVKLQRDNQVTLAKVQQLCEASEVAVLQDEASSLKEEQIHLVRVKPKSKQLQKKCGREHKPHNFGVYGKTCGAFQVKNHFTASCRKITQVSELKDDEDD